MTDKEYIKEALKTESLDFEAITSRLTDVSCIRGLHAALGLVTESAELADAYKKHIFYGKPLDRVNLLEEGGDVFWYMSILIDVLGKDTFDEMYARNIEKLSARYKGQKFSEDGAINRDLDIERAILEK